MPVMGALPTETFAIDLRAVTVRPTWGADEHRRWDRLVAAHHYLPFHGLFGKGLRHVATLGSTWLALIGWQPGAFKLASRDRWIGWTAAQQFSRLHLIANNVRFVILTPRPVANLASRVLGLSLRRLSRDMQAVHGYPVLLAETFVDPARFAGTCYRASNWASLGRTRGYARQPGGTARWRHHGQPKEIFVFELTTDAAKTLCQPQGEPAWNGEPRREPLAAPRLRSLFAYLGEVPEYRRARGKRYALNTVLALAVAARLAGYRGVTAFAQFARLLSQDQLQAVGAFYSPRQQRYTAPSITTFHNILAALAPDTLDHAIGLWTGQQSQPHAPVAMDGKDLRGASKQTDEGRRMMVAAVEHGTGLVLGQIEVDDKTNEIPAVRDLSAGLNLAGRTVTVDAMHAQHETARCLIEDCHADWIVTAIKDNQPTMLDDLKAIDWRAAPWHETLGKAHGRIERRHCSTVDLTGSAWDGYAHLYARRQAVRIERERTLVKTGATSIEVTYCLTSLGPERAGPEQVLALVRNHWHIENRLHYVRDFTYDEDRCRAYVRHLPRNLACLTNAAIAIVRCQGTFRYLPQANRHYAARAQEALDTILNPPTA